MTRPAHPLVIAHRGASAQRSENTLAAFALAVEQRADMIETDLHRSRDGAIVIRHDAELASLGGRLDIGETDLAEIRALNAGEGEPVPILDEVLDRFGAAIPFNLEIKSGKVRDYPQLEAAALGAVEERGLLATTLFSSFSDAVLERLRSLSPRARLAVLASPRTPGRLLDRAGRFGAEAVNPWLGMADRALIDAAHADGLAVYVYTVDQIDDMRRLLDWGVDGLFTNHPDRLRGLLGNPLGG